MKRVFVSLFIFFGSCLFSADASGQAGLLKTSMTYSSNEVTSYVKQELQKTHKNIDFCESFDVNCVAEDFSNQRRYTLIINGIQAGYVIYSWRFIDTTCSECKGHVEFLEIYPEHQQLRLGSILLKIALRDLIRLGCVTITLQACPFREADHEKRLAILPWLIHFYRKHGFQIKQPEFPATTCQNMEYQLKDNLYTPFDSEDDFRGHPAAA